LNPHDPFESQDFKTISIHEYHKSRAKKTKENQLLGVSIFALGFSCFMVLSANIGTKPGQSGHYSSLLTAVDEKGGCLSHTQGFLKLRG
jgi:hypothetical protein